jgi:hypothetical protein
LNSAHDPSYTDNLPVVISFKPPYKRVAENPEWQQVVISFDKSTPAYSKIYFLS